ncbi:Peptidyl-prolyl cis-trans isomerase G [Cinnamomum micranthum f. kanehirae]|uniref:Peptidyl-prolyl cis-trans isomerase G n=1 Tax=Cinnamomum micranthum f. kanehirae TaxID=337451 RepID=A0A3S3NNZ8_9MAGN|nr:Peptidyl-prolyl cis-trans isomerase G [Cinnamomum micranthum f. kanehirae]
MMSKPMVLVFLLLILIITSQFDWKQQLVNDMDSSPSISQKQQQISKREEVVKEKIILSQEKNIQRLKELVQNLREQLVQCRGSNNITDGISNSPTTRVIELQRKQILED